jgi:hypothetical protein
MQKIHWQIWNLADPNSKNSVLLRCVKARGKATKPRAQARKMKPKKMKATMKELLILWKTPQIPWQV